MTDNTPAKCAECGAPEPLHRCRDCDTPFCRNCAPKVCPQMHHVVEIRDRPLEEQPPADD